MPGWSTPPSPWYPTPPPRGVVSVVLPGLLVSWLRCLPPLRWCLWCSPFVKVRRNTGPFSKLESKCPSMPPGRKLQSWLTCRMLCCCTYIGLAAEQLANLHRNAYSCLSVVVLSSLSPYRDCSFADGASVAVVLPLLWFSRSMHQHPTPPPPPWSGGGYCSGANRVLQPAPRKNNASHAKHDIVTATYAMFEMGSCPACREFARVRGNVTPQIPLVV